MISQDQSHDLHKGDSVEYEGAVWTVSAFDKEMDVWSSNPDKIEYSTTVTLVRGDMGRVAVEKVDVEDLLY